MKNTMMTGVVCLAITLFFGWIASAQDNSAEQPVPVKVTGVNYKLMTAFAKDGEADAAYGSLNALKITTAVGVDGKSIENLAGKTLYYVPTKTATPLLNGEEGKTVTVQGKLFIGANAIIVETIEKESNAGTPENDNWDNFPTGTITKGPIY